MNSVSSPRDKTAAVICKTGHSRLLHSGLQAIPCRERTYLWMITLSAHVIPESLVTERTTTGWSLSAARIGRSQMIRRNRQENFSGISGWRRSDAELPTEQAVRRRRTL